MQNVNEGMTAQERFRPVAAPMAMPEQVLVREGFLRALAGAVMRPFQFQR
ncbi:MAG: hypothetical protein KDJ73_04125 [Notoacmeibacter sp.]|nr:hypothetical protein [Notoacmeibacter sp.]